MTPEVAAELQPLVVGTLLIWAGSLKLFSRRSKSIAAHSALSLVLRRTETVQLTFRTVGSAELGVGLLAVLPPHYRWEMILASALGATFIAYVLWAMRRAPERPCGCLGGQETPVSWRTLVRAGLVFMLASAGWAAHRYWLTAIVDNPWLLSAVALEGVLLARLSPELDWIWTALLAPLGRRLRSAAEADCATAAVPLRETEEQLRGSPAFNIVSKFLRSESLEHWRDGCWRFLTYEAEYQNRKAIAVFAVPIRSEPKRVRAALVDQTEDRVLLTVPPSEV